MRHIALALTGTVCLTLLSGCEKKLKTVSPRDQYENMYSDLFVSKMNITTTWLNSTVTIADYPLLQEACNSNYPGSSSYNFDGQLLRFKMQRYSYKMPLKDFDGSLIYNHMYALCYDFYALNATSQPSHQEAMFVHYIGMIDSDFNPLLDRVVNGTLSGSVGLMLDAGFHTGDVTTPAESAWPSIARKTYPDDETDVIYLKMEALNLKVINGYSASKVQKLLGFEFVHGNVTLVNGKLALTDVNIAVVHDIIRPAAPISPAA